MVGFVPRGQAEVRPTKFSLQDVAGEIILVNALHNDDKHAVLRVV